MGRKGGGGGTERGDRVEERRREKRRKGWGFVFIPSLPTFFLPSFRIASLYILEGLSRNQRKLFSLPSPHRSLHSFSVSIFPCHTLLLLCPLPLSFPSCTVYLFEHGGCRETQNQHTVLVLKLS